jgi:hypothetical protein
MAVSVIEQRPIGIWLPVGQDLMFVISNSTAVANQSRVKFCIDIHIAKTIPNVNSTTDLKGTFKTTPNSAGVGMFNIRNILENYVKADNMAAEGSQYKLVTTDSENPHPLHLINKFSLNTDTLRLLGTKFYVEYLDTDSTSSTYNTVIPVASTEVAGASRAFFNGYLKYSDILLRPTSAPSFGFDMNPFVLTDSTSRFLTNAPNEQYANIDDYGTIAFIPTTKVDRVTAYYYDKDGSSLSSEIIDFDSANGAYDTYGNSSAKEIVYFGCFPANLKNWSTIFNGVAVAPYIQGGRIEYVFASLSPTTQRAEKLTIYVNCPDKLGYEPIRLCWLNQWGAWDYYTFTQKSVKSFNTSGSTYTQLQGSWSKSSYEYASYKGGKKSFRVNTTEKITMNTDFVKEIENEMFEELINSPEVYQLDGFQDDPTGITGTQKSILNNYVTPVRLTTSNFTRKTLGNDQLIQYTFEVEKTKTLRTQSV